MCIVEVDLNVLMAKIPRVNTDHVKDPKYEGWNFNSGNYLFTTDTK